MAPADSMLKEFGIVPLTQFLGYTLLVVCPAELLLKYLRQLRLSL